MINSVPKKLQPQSLRQQVQKRFKKRINRLISHCEKYRPPVIWLEGVSFSSLPVVLEAVDIVTDRLLAKGIIPPAFFVDWHTEKSKQQQAQAVRNFEADREVQ